MPPTAPDLTLPECAPELTRYGSYSWSDASFSLYSLVPGVDLKEVAAALQKEWYKEGNETPLVRLAKPTADFAGKTLKDVVDAHVAADKGIKLRRDGGAKGDLSVWPTAFIVVTKKDWRKKEGLLFVYVTSGKTTNGGKGTLHKYFFKLKDAYLMLSSILFGDSTMKDAQASYDINWVEQDDEWYDQSGDDSGSDEDEDEDDDD